MTCAAPAQLGYRMPAEWEPHAATWLSWPVNRNTWRGHFDPVPAVWQRLAETLAPFEPVHIMAHGASLRTEIETMLGDVVGDFAEFSANPSQARRNVFIHDVPTNDAWMRDHGPTFLVHADGRRAMIHWRFNAWGGKYRYDLDEKVPAAIAKITGLPTFEPGIVLEGGSIDVNGCGSVLTTEQCLLNPNRNPELSRAEIEARLAETIAARNVIWLGEGILGDDTDGHVDDLARFVSPRVVVTTVERDPRDDNFAALDDNLRRLKMACDEEGRPLEVLELPTPSAIFREGRRLPASYANFYLANGIVVVPTFGDPADEIALALFRQLFPDREVRGLYAVDLVYGRGAIHCITQQQPA